MRGHTADIKLTAGRFPPGRWRSSRWSRVSAGSWSGPPTSRAARSRHREASLHWRRGRRARRRPWSYRSVEVRFGGRSRRDVLLLGTTSQRLLWIRLGGKKRRMSTRPRLGAAEQVLRNICPLEALHLSAAGCGKKKRKKLQVEGRRHTRSNGCKQGSMHVTMSGC